MAIRALLFVAAIFLSAFMTFNLIGFLQPVNPIINRAFPETPATSCVNDSDCILAIPSMLSECAICDPYGCRNYTDSLDEVVAISRAWQPRCIFSKPPGECVSRCAGGIEQAAYEARCVDGQCVKSRA